MDLIVTGAVVAVSLIVGFLVGALVMHNNYSSFNKTYKALKQERDTLAERLASIEKTLGIK
jgi:uncharacterized membrane-anchored protein YhcB (DUF1043 family)